MTHAVGLVDSISYVASHSKKSSKLGLKMALNVGAIWAVYYYLDVYDNYIAKSRKGVLYSLHNKETWIGTDDIMMTS